MRYYGCKTKLLDFIGEAVESLNLAKGSTFFDMFSGTTAVGQYFKRKGYTIYANDFLEFAHALASCYIGLNNAPEFATIKKHINVRSVEEIIEYLNNLPSKIGFITKNYSPYKKNQRKYLSTENAKKVDAIREKIEEWKKENLINQQEFYYLITALIEAINLVSNVTGTYAAYLKTWDKRALNPIRLTSPKVIESDRKNMAIKGDANEVVSNYKADILYLDPPYNSRQFASNYFFLELIAEGWFGKEPNIYGQTGMRPYEHQKSSYSIKNKAQEALLDLVNKSKARYIILSYNNEGIIPIDRIKEILSMKGNVKEFSKEHIRYRAINQDGSNVRTKESLFLVKTS
jgi:adenine-specific DNA-methyltransferase